MQKKKKRLFFNSFLTQLTDEASREKRCSGKGRVEKRTGGSTTTTATCVRGEGEYEIGKEDFL